MKPKILLSLFLLLLLNTNLFSQSAPGDNYQGRLYRLCKIWGYVKYYHSAVSQCQVNWDSVLVSTIPLVKAANDSNDFNAALLQMLNAAGPMALATTPAPVLDSNAINVDNTWQDDTYFSDSVRAILDTIRNNFRPQAGCNVVVNTYSNPNEYPSWLQFPSDTNNIIPGPYATEEQRLLMFFREWNVLKYFNPNSKILDTPWDSTLLNNVLFISTATDSFSLFKAFLRIASKLNDAHTWGLTQSFNMFYQGYFMPSFAIQYIDSSYVVISSLYPFLQVGDIIDSFDNLSMPQWEDSLSDYLSSGNLVVFRRDIPPALLSGDSGTVVKVVFTDISGKQQSQTISRNISIYSWNSIIPVGDTLTKYRTLGCGIGYVDMANLQDADLTNMYDSLSDKPAIIFDLRNYPQSNIYLLGPLLLPNAMQVAKFLAPDVTYPGNFYWMPDSIGNSANPTPYPGKVILLMNEQTQSASEFDCMVLSQNKNVLKIGSQTAGADGNVTAVIVNTDIITGFTSLGTYYPDGTPTQRIGIVPDVVVKPTIAGFRAGIDEVLDSAIAIACKTTGIVNVENSSFKLYPNPANNFITIEAQTNTDVLQIRINNLLGQQMTEATMNGKISNIDVSNFSSGLYFVSIVDTHGALVKTLKWVKE